MLSTNSTVPLNLRAENTPHTIERRYQRSGYCRISRTYGQDKARTPVSMSGGKAVVRTQHKCSDRRVWTACRLVLPLARSLMPEPADKYEACQYVHAAQCVYTTLPDLWVNISYFVVVSASTRGRRLKCQIPGVCPKGRNHGWGGGG